MKIVLFGAGMQGQAIAYDLAKNPKLEELVIADRDVEPARALVTRIRELLPDAGCNLQAVEIDATKLRAVGDLIAGAACVIGSTTYQHNLGLTRAAIRARCCFCDLGGNLDVVKEQLALGGKAERAGVTVIPDCGLAPGMVNILAYHWARQLEQCDTLAIRVGGLPEEPTPPLGYHLLFSVEGLINEYVEDCEILENGERQMVPGLTGLETLSFPAPYDELEAFYTSGGASTLPQTMAGWVKNLDYKTIRFRGHHQYVSLLKDLGLFNSEPIAVGKRQVVPRRLTAQLLSDYLPTGERDVALIRIAMTGRRSGEPVSLAFDAVDRFDEATGLTAMQRCTGFPVAIIAQMLAEGRIAARGTVPQELAVPAEEFLAELAAREIVFVRRWRPG